MKKIISVFCAVVLFVTSMSVSAFALTAQESTNAIETAYNAVFTGKAGDVNQDGDFSASDARAALLASAGYGEEIDESKADLDGDDMITAIDARTLLRVSAELEDESVLSQNNNLKLFNALANSIKAESLGFRKFTTQQNVDISYDNKNAINKFNDQMNKLAAMVDMEPMDMGKELLAGKGAVSYIYNSGIRYADETNYPVLDQSYVSALKLSDIKSIEYKADQTYLFAPRTNYSTNYPPVELTGLDVLTIYLDDERITDFSNSNNLVHSKAFDVSSIDAIMNEYKDLNAMFTGELADMIGTLTVSTNHILYNDSYISIYFDHDTKKICATEYSMNCDVSIGLLFNLYSFIFGIDVRNETVNITNKEFYKQSYYFRDNYESLAR